MYINAEDAVKLVKPGNRVFIHGGAARLKLVILADKKSQNALAKNVPADKLTNLS